MGRSFNRAYITTILLKSITQSLPQFLFWKDKNSVYLGCNQRFAELVGFRSAEEIIGKTDYDLPWQAAGHTAEFFQQTDQDAMHGRPVDGQEECLKLPDGRQIVTLVSKLPIRDEHQRVLGVVGYFSDITELKEKEQALHIAKQQAEAANRAKSLFIANMSHDLRTPLTGLLGMTQILMQEIHSRRGQEAAGHLLSAGQMLLKLLNEVLDFSQWADGRLPVTAADFSLPLLIDEIVQLLIPAIEAKNLRLVVRQDMRIPAQLCGDEIRLRRILLNLMSNAVKFTPQGEVKLVTTLIEKSRKTCMVNVNVQDTGIGIAPEQQALLFSQFSRLHPAYEGQYSGVGLGLALVKRLIIDLNGHIEYVSQLGLGSRFTCRLPLRLAETKQFQSEKQASRRWQVLLIEDNRLVQLVVKDQLTRLNCEVDLAENGKQALDRTAKTAYDLIVLDIGLPDMDGCEVARQIRQDNHNLNQRSAIVALTAHVGSEDQKVCLEAGIQCVLTKPLQAEQAREMLSRYAGQPCLPAKKKGK